MHAVCVCGEMGEAVLRESERLGVIREIEKKRGSKIISYITADRWGFSAPILLEDVRTIEKHIRVCLAAGAKKIDLFIYTSGGLAIAPWALISLFREYLGARQLGVLVPSRAYSAGTLIALGADDIVMAPGGNLGPIDLQIGIGGRYVGVEDVRGYFNLAKDMGLNSPKDKLHLFSLLSRSTHPLIVGDIYRAWAENERLAMLLMSSRKKPLGEKTHKDIADFLLRRIGDHGQSIRRTEARKIGISYVKDAEDFGIDGSMINLMDAYEALLQIDVPFAGPGATSHINGDEDDTGVPCALVECTERLDVARAVEGARFWRHPNASPKAPLPVGEAADAPQWSDIDARPRFALDWETLRDER